MKLTADFSNTDNDQMVLSFGEHFDQLSQEEEHIVNDQGLFDNDDKLLEEHDPYIDNNDDVVEDVKTERALWFKLFHLINIAKCNQSKE